MKRRQRKEPKYEKKIKVSVPASGIVRREMCPEKELKKRPK